MKKIVGLWLQRFADEGNDGADGAGIDAEQENQSEQENDPHQIVFKDQSELDSWFDKKMNKVTDTLHTKWQKELDTQKSYDEMTDDEKHEYDVTQREKELTDREEKLTVSENHVKVVNKLAKDGLPVGLADVFSAALKDESTLPDVYQAVTGTYRQAVKEGVDRQLALSAHAPSIGGDGTRKTAGETAAERRNGNRAPKGQNLWETH
ncbi:DUF4355 domain-containing protein [Levilactobacillus bambusae]|nr:DUF4355 domain-containing protein [Levilactobacillus bambusae]